MPATWKWETATTDKWQDEIWYIPQNKTTVVWAVATVCQLSRVHQQDLHRIATAFMAAEMNPTYDISKCIVNHSAGTLRCNMI